MQSIAGQNPSLNVLGTDNLDEGRVGPILNQSSSGSRIN